MKVIDVRSGQEMTIGERIDYQDGESVTLLEVRPGLLRAEGKARMVHRTPEGRLSASEKWVPLAVRWTHPRFLFEHVAFFPS